MQLIRSLNRQARDQQLMEQGARLGEALATVKVICGAARHGTC
jgi:hypothetical protein